MRSAPSAITCGIAVAAFLFTQLAPLPAASQSMAQPGTTGAQISPQGMAPGSSPAPKAEASSAMAADGGIGGPTEGWHAVVVSGTVRYLSTDSAGEVAWGNVTAGDVFITATQFETGANGHLLLFNGHDSLTVAPLSSVAVPQNASPAAPIRILQDLGTVRYDVESRNPDSSGVGALLVRMGRALTSDSPPGAVFEVRTPHLAVVVKGTSFTITVTPYETEVVVVEGVVGVSDPLIGDAVDLFAGQYVVRGILEQAGLVVEAVPAALVQAMAKTTMTLGNASLAVGQSLGSAATGASLEIPPTAIGVALGSPTGGTISPGGLTPLGIVPAPGAKILRDIGSIPVAVGAIPGGGPTGSASTSSASSSSGGGSSGGGSSSGGGGARDTVGDAVSRTRDSVSGALGL